MAATANPNDVIQLPRLRAGDLGTLMLELSSTGRGIAARLDEARKAKKRPAELAALPDEVPARILEALDDMDQTRPALAEALRKPEADDGLTPAQRAVDRRLDAGWRCVRQTYELGAERAAMRGDDPLATRLREGLKRALPNGLTFISPVGRAQYTESDTLLGVLEGEQRATFSALPEGAALLRDLRGLHDEYGRAFHITVPAPLANDDGPEVAAATKDSADAAREYIAAVIGSVRRADPKTRALAERLLAPLENYGRPVSAPSTPSADEEKSPARPPQGDPQPGNPI
jgi:hypothetical protein